MVTKKIDFPLSDYTMAQKLDLMEELWNDITRHPEEVLSPNWHKGILQDREQAMRDGKLSVSGWEKAKARIRKKVLCNAESG